MNSYNFIPYEVVSTGKEHVKLPSVAQLVMHCTGSANVVGSIPRRHTYCINKNAKSSSIKACF